MEVAAVETQEEPTQEIKRKAQLTGKVSAITLAGAVVDLGLDVPGIIHISQLSTESVNRVEDVLKMGEEVTAWVHRNPKKDQGHIELTLIEPLGLEWREMRKGMVVSGEVTKIESFGAFVEIGAERPGLVHISELAHDFVKNPHEVVSIGDELEAKILDFDRRKKRIRLSRKAAMAKPASEQEEIFEEIEEEIDNTPTPTAMEYAFKMAKHKQKGKGKAKKSKSNRDQQREEIFSRTLENKVKTS